MLTWHGAPDPGNLTNTEFPLVCLCVFACFRDQTLVLSGLVTHAALSLSVNQARGVPLVIKFQLDNGIQSQPRPSEPLFLLGLVLSLHVLWRPKIYPLASLRTKHGYSGLVALVCRSLSSPISFYACLAHIGHQEKYREGIVRRIRWQLVVWLRRSGGARSLVTVILC